jgi:magnesium transporter
MASGGGSDEGDVFRPSINTRKNSGFYHHANLSNASMDSSALLDHRDQQSMRPRRASTAAFGSVIYDLSRRRGNGGPNEAAMESSDSGSGEDENFPLIKTDKASERNSVKSAKQRGSRPSTSGSRSSPSHPFSRLLQPPTQPSRPYGSVNFPPSVPTSPRIGPIMLGGTAGFGGFGMGENDTIIDIDTDVIGEGPYTSGSPPSSPRDALRSSANIAEEDVCFPVDDALMDDDDETAALDGGHHLFGRCRARREWPDLSVLDAWSREEKEQRSEGIRAKNLPEPVYVGGRLRPPIRPEWHKDEDDAPYRFTYFKEDLPATIHSHTISELLQPGQTFEPLFRPEPVVLDDSSDDEMTPPLQRTNRTNSHTTNGEEAKGGITPPEVNQPLPRLGPRPTFWLDVLRPTDAEMKVISKAFGIHPLTAEDIMMQEAREKVELFRNYYLVSYRTFEQDCNSEDYMEPVNIYVVVFRDGVISVKAHFFQYRLQNQKVRLLIYYRHA